MKEPGRSDAPGFLLFQPDDDLSNARHQEQERAPAFRDLQLDPQHPPTRPALAKQSGTIEAPPV
jgi:hypothetical protein